MQSDDDVNPGMASLGGRARREKLSPDRRTEIARQAAVARWGTAGPDHIPTAIYGSADQPLVIGDTSIPCYVLDDKRRVLAQRALQTSVGMSTSGGSDGAHRLALFFEGLTDRGIDFSSLAVRIRSPIIFRPSAGSKPAYGYEATIINDVCEAILEARKMKKLLSNQKHFAEHCELLLRSLARVGIIDLVDRATGYDRVRFKEDIEKIVAQFVAKVLQPYIPTFPPEYYEHIYQLNNWPFDPTSNQRPGIVGHWTNDIVYARLAPGVLEELRRLTPRDDKGRLKDKLTQRLTIDFGHPKLNEHLSGVMALMKLAKTWRSFYAFLDDVYPRFDTTMKLPFHDAPAMERIGADPKAGPLR